MQMDLNTRTCEVAPLVYIAPEDRMSHFDGLFCARCRTACNNQNVSTGFLRGHRAFIDLYCIYLSRLQAYSPVAS